MITIFIATPVFDANSVDPGQTPRSGLGLQCLPMSFMNGLIVFELQRYTEEMTVTWARAQHFLQYYIYA